MADETSKILIDIEVDNKDFDQELGRVNTELKKNREEVKKLSKDYESNATEIAKLERANKELSGTKRELIKESQTEGNSLNSLRLRLAQLTKERNAQSTVGEENIKQFNKLQKAIKATSDEIKGFEQEGGDFRRNVGNYTSAVKGFGLALKATGIGLIVAALAKLREGFLRNQKIVDLVTTATNALTIVFDDLISFFTEGINVTSIFNNIIEGLSGAVFTVVRAINAVKRGEFAEAFDIVSSAVKRTTDSIFEYARGVKETAEAQTELENTSRLNEIQQQRAIQQFERQAEIQRQIRDDERKGIFERIEANAQLGIVLGQQAAVEKDLLQTRVNLARLNLEQNDNIENQIALQEALLAQEDTLNRLEGQRSENLVNQASLERELLELRSAGLDEGIEGRIKDINKEADARIKSSKAIVRANEAVGDSFIALDKGGKTLLQSSVQLAGQQSALGKAVALSEIIVNSARGISGAIAAGAGIPFPANLGAIASGVATVVSGIANAKNILSSAGGVPSGLGSVDVGSSSISSSGTSAQAAAQQATIIQPGLLSQFSQPVQNQVGVENAAANQPNINPVVSVVDISKGLSNRAVKVGESSL